MNIDQFKLISILICFVADVLFFIFLKTYILNINFIKKFFHDYEKLFEVYRPELLQLTPLQIEQISELMIKQCLVFVGIYFLINFIAYIFYYQDKAWAIKYISRGTALFGIIFSFITIYEAYQFSIPWAIVMTLLVPLYGFVYIGCRYFFKKNN